MLPLLPADALAIMLMLGIAIVHLEAAICGWPNGKRHEAMRDMLLSLLYALLGAVKAGLAPFDDVEIALRLNGLLVA